MKKYVCEQGSVEWYECRMGIPTASMFHKICTPGGKLSEQRHAYMYRLIAERLLCENMDEHLNVEWIERGKLLEPDAVQHFQFTKGVKLERIGFITDDKGRIGASPDRLVEGKPESVEIKCPAPWTHMGYLLDGPGNDYKPQVQGHLLIGNFDAVHFYSYHPRMPAFHLVTPPDAKFQKLLAAYLQRFLEELYEAEQRARKLGAYVVTTGFQTPLDRYAGPPEPLTIVIPE